MFRKIKDYMERHTDIVDAFAEEDVVEQVRSTDRVVQNRVSWFWNLPSEDAWYSDNAWVLFGLLLLGTPFVMAEVALIEAPYQYHNRPPRP